MTPFKWLRLCGTSVSAALVFLLSCACLAGGIGAQSAESAIAGPSLSTAAPSPFLVAPTIPLGYAPSSVAAGDLRQSGRLDLVTADYASGNITVFLGAGKGKFAPGVEYAAGSHPSSVRIADVNGDGRPDVLVTNQTEGTISVLFGNGDGTFQARQSFKVGFNPSFIAMGDFNGNGKVDVAAAGASGKLLAILLNDGNGNLQKPVMELLSKTPTALTAGDFNHDGHTDLALANADGTVSILLGKGAGMFRSLPDLTVAPGSLSSIEAGDLSNSGKIDLIVTEPGRKLVSVLMGKGDGTFASPASYPVGNEPVSTVVADVNGDGVPALVVINKSSNTFSILGGNGDGTFKASVDFVAGNAPLAAVAGDFYGDGHIDLAIINHSSQTVSVPTGNGDGTFKAARSFASGVQPMSVASGTLNGGKIPALVVANYCGSDSACGMAGTVAVFLADEKGDYRLSSTYSVGAGPVSVALADLNGDRKSDIVALNRLDKTLSVMIGLGDGTFRQAMTFPLAGTPLAVAVGDLNKDGKLDLAVLEDCGSAKCSQPGNVEVLLGGGDGSFRSAQSYSAGYSPTSIAVGDINGDKNLDLVIANRCGNDASCHSAGTGTVLIGDGTGKFSPGKDVALGNSPSSIALGKLSGPALDLVVARSTDNAIAVLRGNGDGTFKTGVPYAVGNQPGSLVVADFNGDGKPDVAVTNLKDSTVSVLFGKGDGTLQRAAALPVGNGPVALASVGRASTKHAGLATANGSSVSGDGTNMPGTEISVLPNLQGDPPLTSFTVVPSPAPNSNVNDMVMLTATLTGAAPNMAPTGTVTFDSDPGTGAAALSDCTNVSITAGMAPSVVSTAVCTTQMLTAGTDAITGVYSGDGTYDTGVGETSPSVTQTVAALPATLSFLATSPSASVMVGTAVTFTAQIAASAVMPIQPAGTFTFTVNGSPSADCPPVVLSGGAVTATCTTSSLVTPADVIDATYAGDPNFTAAAAATTTEIVTKGGVFITFGSSLPSASVNQTVTFSATVAPSSGTEVQPTGSVTFTQGATTLCNAAPINTTTHIATCNYAFGSSAPSPGSTITATYNGDTNFPIGTQTLLQVVTPAGTTTTLSSTPLAPTVDQQVTFTAVVTPAFTGAGTPTGTVTFVDNTTSTTLCLNSPLTGGIVPPCNFTFLTAGPHSVVATYTSGDTNFTGSPSSADAFVVSKTPTTTTVAALPSPSTVNQAVTFTASITPAVAGATNAGGTVTFSYAFNGGAPTTICVAAAVTPAAVSTAMCQVPLPAAGTYVVTAQYNGDPNFIAGSGTALQVVNSSATTTHLASSGSPSSVNQPVTFTATVTSNTAGATTPTGVVTFSYSLNGGASVLLCSNVSVVEPGGTSTCLAPLPTAGNYSITAVYSGDQNFTTSTVSAPQVVGASATTTKVTSSPSPSTPNQAVTFTATITPTFAGATALTGTVAFSYSLNGGASVSMCASAAVTAGVATCTVPLPSSGSYAITALYTSGNTNFTGSTGLGAQTVGSTATITAVTSLPSTSAVNQLVTFTATITPVVPGATSPTGSVTFTSVLNGGAPVTLCLSVPVSLPPGNITAACSFKLAASGNYTITATYTSGDGNFSGSAGTLIQPVGGTATTTAISEVPNATALVNGPITFTATVKPVTSGATNPTGTVSFSYTLNAGPVVPLCVSAAVIQATGIATCAVSLPSVGAYSITAQYSGDTNFQSSNLSVPYSVTQQSTSVNVSATATAPASPVVNQPITFVATVVPGAAGNTQPTQTVTFSYTGPQAGTLCQSVPVSTAGTTTSATCVAPLPVNGAYTIKAAYSGDSNFTLSSGNLPLSVGATATMTSLASLPNPSAVNQSVAFTATVTPAYAGATKPTGTVVFSNTSTAPATQLCSVTLVGGVVPVCNFAFAAQGTFNVTATYTSGDTNFSTSTSTAISQGVGAGATAVVLSSSPPASVINQPVTFTATINTNSGSTAPQGTMVYTDTLTNKVLCSVALTPSGSVPACTFAFPALGTHTITAAYTSSNANFSNATSSVLSEAVTQASTTTSVVSAPNPSNVNQSVAFTATVTPAFSGATNPTGTVVFSNTSTSPATPLCSVTLTGGTVPVCNSAFAAKGTNNVIAIYTSGDANFGSSTSSAVAQVVGSGATSVTLAASPNPSSVDQPVTFNATINFVTSGTAQPTGTVTYFDGGVQLSNCLFTGTVAAPFKNGSVPPCTVPLITQGSHIITAQYTGDGNFLPSTSLPLSQTVNTTTTTTSVASATNPSAVNALVTFTATVTPSFSAGKATPMGTVSFSATPAGGVTAPLTCVQPVTVTTSGSGVTTASCTAPLNAAGNYTVTAAYSTTDTNFASSTGTITQSVNKANLTLALLSSYKQPNGSVVISPPSQGASLVNQALTFMATITIPTAGTSPVSTVTFNDTSTGATLCPDIAVVATSSPTIFSAVCVAPAATQWMAATHTIVATYNAGDPNFPSTASPVFKQVVTPGPATETLISSMQVSVATQQVTFTATIIPSIPGPVLPTGDFKFTTTGTWAPVSQCQSIQVTAAAAVCTVVFPATAETQTITATYENDSNFIPPTSSIVQTVQNFIIANSVTSALNPTSTTGPVTLTQGYSTVNSAGSLTDPFNPTKVQLVVTSMGGFADTLDLTCQVVNANTKEVVPDPSCTVKASEPGTTGTTLTYQVSASATAAIGQYTVTLTAKDDANQSLSNATALTVYVVGQANLLSLAQGASGTENATFNTTTAPANATFTSFACGTVWNLTTLAQLSTSQIAGLTCTGPASVTISGANPPPPVTVSVPITISTLGTVAQLQRTSTVSLAAFLGIPLFALMGWVGTRKSPRKNFFRFLGLILLLVGVSYASGCGGSFTSTSQTTSTGIAPGSYLVQVVGTDQKGNKYYAVVPLDVSKN